MHRTLKNVTSWLVILALGLGLVTSVVSVAACATVQKAAPYLPGPDDVACVIEEVDAGHDDPVAVANKCGLTQLLIEDVLKLIMGAKKAKARRMGMAPDAGDGGK